MARRRRESVLRGLGDRLNKISGIHVSMRIRLLTFLFMGVALLVFGIGLFLLLTGRVSTSTNETERYVQREFSAISRRLKTQYGDMANQVVTLSQALSRSLEFQLANMQIPASELKDHPEVLEEIIENELSRLLLAVESVDCSGVFMVLDATISPHREDAEDSRAGIYIRFSEPRMPGPANMMWDYLRGFPHIAYRNGLVLPSIWDMEFEVKDRAFFRPTMDVATESTQPLSKLYYWSIESIIPNLNESLLLCSIPLLDSYGNAFGVCGLEMSAWNFNASFAPDDNEHRGFACILSEIQGDSIFLGNALFAGRQTVTGALRDTAALAPSSGTVLHQYVSPGGMSYLGLHEELSIYPSDSPYSDRRLALSLLIAKDTIDQASSREMRQFITIGMAVLVLGFGVSLYISGRYLSPIVSAFDAIRAGNLDEVKTNIVEIDLLIDKIREQGAMGETLPVGLFEGFVSRAATLTPTEMGIVRAYSEGMTDKDILAKVFISKQTLQKHMENICRKLGMSSRDELMLYVELIRMSGLTDTILRSI